MSLIERALAAEPTRRDAAVENREEEQGRAPAPFALDYDFLARQGFYTPSDKPQRLSLELRAVKRRLLRRLDFQTSRRKRADASAGGVAKTRQRNVVLTTSTRPAEGKTFTAINLALSLAVEDGIGTVLIDADVPRPKVMSHFGLSSGPGLTDLIARDGELRLSDCLLHAQDAPLALLPEGEQPGSGAALFGREEAGAVIRAISQRYPDRLIIIDAPPVLATSEAVILARHADEVCFVVEANGTPEPAVATALDELLDVTERVSIVLNKCLVAESAIHYGSYEEYYYKQGRSGRRDG
jgi:Mrp family chromosome partitioning ATPase